MNHHVITETAEAILSKTFGQQIRLRNLYDPIGNEQARNRIYRAELVDAPPGAPRTIIIKRANLNHQNIKRGMGLDDWAGMQFLNSIPATADVVPRFYGGDIDNELFIMEDLSDNEGRLRDLSEGNDRDFAEAMFIECMVATGKIHAATIGRKTEYHRLRNSLGPTPDKKFHHVNRIIQGLKQFDKMAQLIGVSLSPQAYQDIESALTTLENPGPFCAYTQGDLTPGNCLRFRGQIKLYDFEMGLYRHALIDGTYPHIRYLTCGNAGQIPSTIRKRMEVAYREELIKDCPEASDDLLFFQAVVAASAGWLGANMTRLLLVLERDREWGWLTLRQRILGCLDAFANITEEHDQLLALGATARTMWKHLADRWPEASFIPYFTAFDEDVKNER